ncbi:MAG: gluconate 2-dehydrogenase subunit 3 family protein [Acidobacteriota bacterium]|nr:gluconate 2-dehydrogenase subunit 3 family protein [Acidobacteriota bacterium]
MSSYSTDRRSVLKIISAIGATCAYPFAGDELYGQTEPAHVHEAAPAQSSATFFRQEDFATISRIADLIIPETDTPGAARSGVPEYIDMVVGRNTDQQLLVADGLRWLDAEATRNAEKKFMQLSEQQQLSILEPLCEAVDANNSRARNVQFFGLIKRLTADGYYTSRIGLIDELGYKGNMVRAGFPDCVHEH